MVETIMSVLKFAWPIALAAAIWMWQEGRIVVLDVQLATSHKRETVLQSNLDTAHQRATDLALLYAGMLDKPEQARKAQEEADHAQLDSLQHRVDELSHAPTLHFSGAAVSVFNDVSSFANGGDAVAAPEPAAGTPTVPPAADVSEADAVQHDQQAAEAYRDAVKMLNECRALYNSARSAQLQVNKP